MTGPGARDPEEWDPDDSARLPDPRMIPRTDAGGFGSESVAQRLGSVPPPLDRDEREHRPPQDATVRPFLLTGGRTRPVRDGLLTHTMVVSPLSAAHAPLRFELRQIVHMCQEPLSVAEIAARLHVPLGVARVLIADLISTGYADAIEQDQETLSVEIIERIIQHVRAL